MTDFSTMIPTIPEDVIFHGILPDNPTLFLRVSTLCNQYALTALTNSNINNNNSNIQLLCHYLKHGNVKAVRIILNNPLVNVSDDYNRLLKTAFVFDNIDAVKLIMGHPQFTLEPIGATENRLYPILSAAVLLAGPQIVSYLLHYKNFDPLENNNLPMRVAANENNTEIVKMLLEDPRVPLVFPKGDYFPLEGYVCPLACACSYGNKVLIERYLADRRIQYSNFGRALVKAASEGFADIVKLLLDDNRIQNIEYFGAMALVDACSNAHNDAVRHLLGDKRIDPNYEGKALLTACMWRRETTVKLLLSDERTIVTDQVFNIVCSKDKVTPSDFKIVSLLVDHKNKVNETSFYYLASIVEI